MRHKFPDNFVTIGHFGLEQHYSKHAPHDILTKLRHTLGSLIGSEGDVVYVFILIRKLLELDKHKRVFPTLSLICDWIAHVRLDRNSTGYKIIENIDRELYFKYAVLDKRPYDRNRTKAQERHIERQLAGLWTLRGELRFFLRHYHLPITIVNKTPSWNRLRRFLFNALANSPLTVQTADDLLVIKSISFTSVWHEAQPQSSRARNLFNDPPYPRCRILVKDGIMLPGTEHMNPEDEQIIEVSLKTVDIRDFISEEEFVKLQKTMKDLPEHFFKDDPKTTGTTRTKSS